MCGGARRRTNWHSIGGAWRRQGEIGRCSAGNEVETRGAAAERAEEVRAANGRAAGIRVRGGAAARGGGGRGPHYGG
jgi:hypothetical protein